MTEEDRLARVLLSFVVEPGRAETLDMVTRDGAPAVCDRLRALPVARARLDELEPGRELEVAARQGIRFVVPGDAEWPQCLDDLVGVRRDEQGGIPVGLWVRGPLRLDALTGPVAVVGSRDATTYGADLAREIAAAVGRSGRAVVSGAAFGIDQAAHRGALLAPAPTVAVLACGADRVYPEAHRELIQHLAAHGAVVSETAPGGAPMRARFLSRNRLIAALTTGTVVVEAAYRSGALSTAHWASRVNRAVMGVPGPVTSAQSTGVHELVRTGMATLVTSGEEVLEVVGSAGQHLLEMPRGPDRPRDLLSQAEQRILEAVPVARGATSQSVGRVVGLTTDEAHVTLLRLEIKGMVEFDGVGWRLAAAAGA